MKTESDHFRKLHTAAISLQWKVKKRKNPPQAVLDAVNSIRLDINRVWTVTLSCSKLEDNVEVNKTLGAMNQWKDEGSKFPIPVLYKVVFLPPTGQGNSCQFA